MVTVFGFGIGVFGAILIGLVAGVVSLVILLEVYSGKTNGEMKSLKGAAIVFIVVVGAILVVVPRGYDGPATYTGIEEYHDSKGKLVQTPKVQIEGIDGLYEVTNTEIAAYKAGDTVDVHCVAYSCLLYTSDAADE